LIQGHGYGDITLSAPPFGGVEGFWSSHENKAGRSSPPIENVEARYFQRSIAAFLSAQAMVLLIGNVARSLPLPRETW
jgi:hypothetical protein